MRWANGRDATTRSCARFRREAAIIFIALVICCVDLTARIRRRRSISDGICIGPWGLSGGRPRRCLRGRGELLRELLQRRFQSGLDLVVEGLLLRDAGDDAGVARLEEAIELLLVTQHVLDGDAVEEALRRGVDDR